MKKVNNYTNYNSESKANYFVCVRVTNPQVHQSITNALDWILDKDNQYQNFCYTTEMLHVTICEVYLETDADIQKVNQTLQQCYNFFVSHRPKSQLQFIGLKTFFEKVLVADVKYEEDFRSFCDYVVDRLKLYSVKVVEKHEFNPHMTIMKVNTVRAENAKVEKINPWLFVNLKRTHFGDQAVESIHLCKMGYERREDGFYKTPAEIFFASN